jgi:hypothetical protein
LLPNLVNRYKLKAFILTNNVPIESVTLDYNMRRFYFINCNDRRI